MQNKCLIYIFWLSRHEIHSNPVALGLHCSRGKVFESTSRSRVATHRLVVTSQDSCRHELGTIKLP